MSSLMRWVDRRALGPAMPMAHTTSESDSTGTATPHTPTFVSS